MGCNYPLVGVPDGVNPETGKTHYKILPYSEKYFESGIPGVIQVPCGRCIGCKIDYSRMWANRCMMELKYHDSAYFVTITYSPEFVPKVWYVDESTGEANEALSLRKKHFQLFMKNVRKMAQPDKVRFFAAGEYGSKTWRPHYHAILFGLRLNDLILVQQGESYNYYTSPSLQRCWDVVECKRSITPLAYSHGQVVVADVNWQTCAYVARYVVKKLRGDQSDFYSYHNIEPPFSLMSRRPGIGRQYYDDHPDLFDYDYINVATPDGGRKFRPPKYYNRLLEEQDPDRGQEQRQRRMMIAQDMKRAKQGLTTLSYADALKVEARSLESKIESMKRSI